MTIPQKIPYDVDFSSQEEMGIFGIKVLQARNLSEGIYLRHYRHLPWEILHNTFRIHSVNIFTHVSPYNDFEENLTGKIQKRQIKQLSIIVMPAEIEHYLNWNQTVSYLSLDLDPIVLKQKLNDIVKGDTVELLPHFSFSDPLISSIFQSLQQELFNPGLCGQLYIDSLLQTFYIHLLRNYCVQKPIQISPGSLSKTILNQVIDYIQANLHQDLTLTELAAIAKVSPNYFATQFKKSIGITPHQYVIGQRVAKAKQLLLTGKLTLAEIAYSVGFVDQSHLIRHFKKAMGVTPKKFLLKQ
ncbi:AraC family transcriptional regulator [Dapis sp. BLCC M126]|uniref:AraC family transcriptional regulator n=1 Tax=Dapis sp. BLCC M126 TaxID=3400189 RepID=UPI003CEFC81B